MPSGSDLQCSLCGVAMAVLGSSSRGIAEQQLPCLVLHTLLDPGLYIPYLPSPAKSDHQLSTHPSVDGLLLIFW